MIPYLLLLISTPAGEVGFMLSALLVLCALVLGFFSFRETLGKVTVVCSILTLLGYGVVAALMVRLPGPAQPGGGQAEMGNSQL